MKVAGASSEARPPEAWRSSGLIRWVRFGQVVLSASTSQVGPTEPLLARAQRDPPARFF